MKANYYEMRGERAYIYENLPKIEIGHPFTEPKLDVAIGIDPSTSSTGFTLGRVDMDYPIIGMEFKRDKAAKEPHSVFINSMIDYIIYCIIGCNNLNVTHIFSEDKFEYSKKYSRNTQELLSAVKVAVNSLPSRIKGNGQEKTPKLILMKPSEWRKVYLGEHNTNAVRDKIKDIVCNFTINKYGFNPNCVFYEDCLESVGLYSAGFRKYIEPTLANSKTALVDFSNIDWSHVVEMNKIITSTPEETLKTLLSNNVIKTRADKYGLKGFTYERGYGLEQNIRGLTSKSNAVFLTVLEGWDMEAVPVYYEMRQTPNTNKDKLLILAYRKHEKVF